MRAFIYTGGETFLPGVTERPADRDLTLAADAGYLTARRLGIQPALLIGDFDSLGEPETAADTELIRVPAEKDLTDTQLTVQTALERGAREVVIIGGLGGRLDHTLSNLAILEDLRVRNIPALVTDGKNRVRFLRNGSVLITASPQFRYLSLIAADPVVRGVTLEGCKYPLSNAKLSRRLQYAVSNEITGSCALIAVRRGGVWIVESRD